MVAHKLCTNERDCTNEGYTIERYQCTVNRTHLKTFHSCPKGKLVTQLNFEETFYTFGHKYIFDDDEVALQSVIINAPHKMYSFRWDIVLQ